MTDDKAERIIRPAWFPLAHPGLRVRHSIFILCVRPAFTEMGHSTAWYVKRQTLSGADTDRLLQAV